MPKGNKQSSSRAKTPLSGRKVSVVIEDFGKLHNKLNRAVKAKKPKAAVKAPLKRTPSRAPFNRKPKLQFGVVNGPGLAGLIGKEARRLLK